MADLYLLLALDAPLRDWLATEHVPLPDPATPSRFPTLGEVKAALRGLTLTLTGGHAPHSVDLHLADRATGWATTLWLTAARHDPYPPQRDDTPVRATFGADSPELAVALTEKLSHRCGPLVLLEADHARPLVVTPGTKPAAAVKGWLAGLA